MNERKKDIADECPVCGDKPLRERYYKYKESVGPKTFPKDATYYCVHFAESNIYPFCVYFHS